MNRIKVPFRIPTKGGNLEKSYSACSRRGFVLKETNSPAQLKTRFSYAILVCWTCFAFAGCAMQWGAEAQWDSKSQILMSEASQVKLRSVQTRVFDTVDKEQIMHVIISTMQDLFFDIEVVDQDLGVLSGKRMYQSGSSWANNPTYYTYKLDSLIIFHTNYRTYGPFQYRNDVTRLTVTVRPRGETQLLVRASVQYNLRAIDDQQLYQKFFKTLGQALFLEAQKAEG